jgi:hypothetical protein
VPTPREKLPREFWCGGAIIALVFVVLTVDTWRKWGDAAIDFGVQLYLPWKISTGTVLYRDVAYLTGGPLSQYYHALLFRVFGVSVLTLVISNLVLLAVLLAIVYSSFYRASNLMTAFAAAAAFLLVFAFANYTPIGIFNYVTPYSEELLHGLVLSALMLAALSQWLTEKMIAAAALAGFCAGLILLTKPEIGLGALAALVAAVILGRQCPRKGWLILLAAAAVPLLSFLIYFGRLENFPNALRHVFWAWVPVLTHSLAGDPFYRWCLGLDAPAYHLQEIGEQFFGLAAFIAVSVVIFRAVAATCWARPVFVAACLVTVVLAWRYPWRYSGYTLPPLMLVLLAMLLWRWRREGLQRANVFPILWTVFSLVLLAKLGLFARIWHYGFALAMPAFLAAVYLLLWELPEALRAYRVQPLYLRTVLAVGIFVGCAQLIRISQYTYSRRDVSVAADGDRVLLMNPAILPSGAGLAATLQWVQNNTPPDSTIAVLPEGVMLNYLSRRANPAGYLRWNTAELAVFGQENMNAAFTNHSPDYVILLERDMREFGVRPFGEEDRFGLKLMQWIRLHYKPIYKFDSPSIVIFRKNTAANGLGLPIPPAF